MDDDPGIHHITTLVLQELVFKDKKMEFVSAYSAKEAIETLTADPHFAIVLLDIGMETSDAGLEVARFIRQQLQDDLIRIIIRTGQPGDVPEREIIDRYDINDYKSKTDLTIERLFTTIRTALSQYEQINELSQLNEALEIRIAEALQKQQQQQDALFIHNRSIQMGEMLNMLAHQWRQPLSSIAAVTARLKLSLALDEVNTPDFAQHLDNIETYTCKLSTTIDQFRELYEHTNKSPKITVHELLTHSIEMVKSHFENLNIQIDYTPVEDLKSTLVTRELYQVIICLFKNAQEAFLLRPTERPTITVNLSQDDYLCIQVQDNAGGIEEEDLPKVCDPYFSTKTNKNGQGLGLYMSNKVVQQHCNGYLDIHNKEGGTCINIYIRP